MNTHKTNAVRSRDCTRLRRVATTIGLLVLSSTYGYAGDFQQNLLFSPSQHILLAEADGRIMIYDQLKSETVDKAMDDQFDRIENMMFVRTQYQQEDGNYEAMNDDCD